MKKILLVSFVIFSSAIAANASCYSAFSEAFDNALEVYNADVNRCGYALTPEKCMRETDAKFGSAVDQAGTTYYHCMLIE
jgi:hypothetical protein